VPVETPSLISALQSRTKGVESLRDALADACSDLRLGPEEATTPVCIGYALLKLGVMPEDVSKMLSWREFEQLSAAIIRVSGYAVKENLVLKKPRAQLDVVATGDSLLLSIDCKHYRRGHSASALAKFAQDQLRRSALLRMKLDDRRPIASVILSMSEPEGKFVEGVAVVPIRALRSFLTTIDSYLSLLELK
jgi:hypothetical protein